MHLYIYIYTYIYLYIDLYIDLSLSLYIYKMSYDDKCYEGKESVGEWCVVI